MSTFTPPLFSKFGSGAKGVLESKHDTRNHTVKTVRRSTNGITMEAGATFENPRFANLQGFLKGSYASKPYNFDININTNATENNSVGLKVNRLYPGFTLNLQQNTAHEWVKKQAKTPTTIVETTLIQDAVALHSEFKGDSTGRYQAKPSVSIGFDNFSFGGSAVILSKPSASTSTTHDSPSSTTTKVTTKQETQVDDYNLGFEYTQPQFTASLVTEKKLDWAVASLSYKLKPNHTLAAQGKLQVVGEKEKHFTIGNEYKVDATTTVKGKLQLVPVNKDDKNQFSNVSIAVEHKLSNPNVAVNFAAKLRAEKVYGGKIEADSFGMGFTFGDY